MLSEGVRNTYNQRSASSTNLKNEEREKRKNRPLRGTRDEILDSRAV